MLITFNQINYTPSFKMKNIPRAELESMLAKDKTVKQIARKFGVAESTIAKRIKKYNLQLPSAKLRERFENEALPLLEQGLSLANIRKLTGINEEYVRGKIKKNSYSSVKEYQKQRLEELVNQNYSDEEIADILYMQPETVRRKRSQYRYVRKKGRPGLNINWAEILEELKNGKTAPEIAKERGICTKLILEKIKEISGMTPKKIELEYRKIL